MKYDIKSVKAEGFEMEYMQFGSGERAMVILPGISLSSVLLSASSVAEAFVQFAEKFTVYLFDRKKNMQKGYSVENMADDTAIAMRMAGIEKACIFGASQGGMIAQYIAAKHPEIVERLFIASSLSKPNETFLKNIEKMDELAEDSSLEEMNRFFFELVYSAEYLEKYKDAFDYLARLGTKQELERFAVQIEACRSFDISSRISEIRCPAFAVGSAKDKMVTGEATVETAELIGCDYYLYEGYGHAVYDEAPDYRDRIMKFFEG